MIKVIDSLQIQKENFKTTTRKSSLSIHKSGDETNLYSSCCNAVFDRVTLNQNATIYINFS